MGKKRGKHLSDNCSYSKDVHKMGLISHYLIGLLSVNSVLWISYGLFASPTGLWYFQPAKKGTLSREKTGMGFLMAWFAMNADNF